MTMAVSRAHAHMKCQLRGSIDAEKRVYKCVEGAATLTGGKVTIRLVYIKNALITYSIKTVCKT